MSCLSVSTVFYRWLTVFYGVHCVLQTVRFKNELERNITIKLGYANAKVCPVCVLGLR